MEFPHVRISIVRSDPSTGKDRIKGKSFVVPRETVEVGMEQNLAAIAWLTAEQRSWISKRLNDGFGGAACHEFNDGSAVSLVKDEPCPWKEEEAFDPPSFILPAGHASLSDLSEIIEILR